MGKLTVLAAKALEKPGRYTDGDGLHLYIRSSGRKAWVLRFMKHGVLRDMGLGPFPAVSLAKAREAARAARDLIRDGQDPIGERRGVRGLTGRSDRTFKAAAEDLIRSQSAGWRNAKHADQWTSTLKAYAYPVFGDRHIQDVDTALVLEVLRPIWNTKTETATRVRGRIEAVLDSARALHWRTGENPARWKGHLASLLPRPSKVRAVEHHPALPWERLAAFLPMLRQRGGASAQAIEFAVLTAARSGEVRGLTRRELNLDDAMWVVPKGRMKSHREHRVPLSTAALAFLRRLDVAKLDPDDLVFPGQKHRTGLSDMSLTAVLRRMNTVEEEQKKPWVDGTSGEPITVHGFRSTFRVWAGEETAYAREIIEAALAHVVEDGTERAYQRSDLAERRRALMEDWGRVCSQSTAAT